MMMGRRTVDLQLFCCRKAIPPVYERLAWILLLYTQTLEHRRYIIIMLFAHTPGIVLYQ